jgi:hypothetical protein
MGNNHKISLDALNLKYHLFNDQYEHILWFYDNDIEE